MNNRYLPLVLLLTMSGCAFDLGALRGTGVLEDAGGLVGDGSILVDAGLEGDAGPPTCCAPVGILSDLSIPCCMGLVPGGGQCSNFDIMEGTPCRTGVCGVGYLCEFDGTDHVCHADPTHVVLPECGADAG